MLISALPAGASQNDKDEHLLLPREDTAAWLPGAKSRSAEARISYLKENAASHWFEPNLTYTFSYSGDVADLAKFSVAARVGSKTLTTFDMTAFLNGVPVIEQAVRRSDRSQIAWSFELWNERLLSEGAESMDTSVR